MSYNTRRAGGFVNQQSVGNVGQRRPVVTNNFVPGGQLNPTNKPAQPQQQQARPPVQNQQAPNTSIQFRNQQNSLPQQTNVQPPIPQTKQQFEQQFQQQQPQFQLQQLQQQEQLQQQQLQKQQLQQQQVKNETSESIVPMNGVEEAVDSTVEKKKPFWAKAGRISKKEKVRRRNIRLSKILQPKNAVMILNELVKNTSYMVEDLPSKTDENQFKATVLYEGQECVGYGRSKIHAKNSAAEAALRHYVKNNKMTEMRRDEEGNLKMEVSEEDLTKSPLPWQHVASFAIFKLFSSWGEDPNLAKSQQTSTETMSGVVPKPHENRPSRKMPANPETINPLMLINQMLPHAHFEEVGKSGTPPNVVFTFECIVDEQRFMGTGSNKKAAKKLAAYGACHKILSINYPPEVYTPLY